MSITETINQLKRDIVIISGMKSEFNSDSFLYLRFQKFERELKGDLHELEEAKARHERVGVING